MSEPWYRDADGDGFGNPTLIKRSCYKPAGYVSDNGDCDDANPAVGGKGWYYRDSDLDGYGTGTAQYVCLGSGWSANNADCKDDNAAYRPYANLTCGTNACTYNTVPSCLNSTTPNTCTPKSPQEVCDGADNDCDGQADNMPPQDCGKGECKRTVTTCQRLCVYDAHLPNNEKCTWSRTPCEMGIPVTETCDTKDNDCNGAVDNAPGSAQPNTLTRPCDTPNGCSQVGTQTCQAGAIWTVACSGCGGEARCTTAACKEDNYVSCNAQCVPDTCPDSIPERCNQCDDDLDGVKDDGVSCQPCDL